MAKRFKLKLSCVIPSFQSCRSKDPSTLPSNPVPSLFRLSPVKPMINVHLPLPPSKPNHHHSSFKRHVSSAFTSMGCGFGSKSSAQHCLFETDHTESPPTPEFHWEKEDKWHVIAKIYDDEATSRRKIYNSSASENDDVFLPPHPPKNTEKKKKKRRVVQKKTKKIRVSTSSPDSGLFSSETLDDEMIKNEETETLVSSSRSLSTDSSPSINKARRRRGRRREAAVGWSPARLSRFQWLIPCTVEGKVRESFAVVKKSEDPYEDFKRSMMEMIMEKQMFEDKDLEQLLHCFLSLNSKHHHPVIVQAFAEIWQALFSSNTVHL